MKKNIYWYTRMAAALMALTLLAALFAVPSMAEAETAAQAAPNGGLWQMVGAEVFPGNTQPESTTPETATGETAETATAEQAAPADGGLEVRTFTAGAAAETGTAYACLNRDEQAAYQAFEQSVYDVERRALVRLSSYTDTTPEEAATGINAYLYDHPETFWTNGYYSFAKRSGTNYIMAVGLSDMVTYRTKASLQGDIDRYNAAANAIIAKIDGSAPPALIARQAYEAVVAHVSYDHEGAADRTGYMPHTAFNAFVNGSAVCDGYSKMYLYLLRHFDIPAVVLPSQAIDHAWNAVELGSGWYEVDCTWDDADAAAPRYEHYNLTTAQMAAMHRGQRDPDGVAARMPVAYGTHFTKAYLDAGGKALPEGEGPGGVKLSARLALWDGYGALDSRPYADSWTLVLLQNGRDAGSLIARAAVQGSSILQVSGGWSEKSSRLVLSRGTGSDGSLTLRLTFDNGSTTTLRCGKLAERMGTGTEGFVSRLYRVCLGRAGADGDVRAWAGQLNSGAVTGSKAATGFLFSNEFQAQNYCNTHYVVQLYAAFMGRDPSAGDISGWVKKLETGMTREQVFNGFAGSDEFARICRSYGITPGAGMAIGPYGTLPHGPCAADGTQDGVTSFVERLYSVCLGRKADQAGLKDWTNQLWNHSASGAQAAMGFVFSKEFKAKNYDNTAYVQRLYQAFMGRGADPAGLAGWVNELDRGKSREDVFRGFVGSNEFTAICQKYGIVRG